MTNNASNDEQELTGGGINRVVRVGDTVRRPSQPWSARMHQLFGHLEKVGFTGAPRSFGNDELGRDVFGYLDGEVGHYPWTPAVASDAALANAGRLLRDFHAATADVAGRWLDGWQSPAHEPVEVICHNDLAPYNLVYQGEEIVGIIDFDTAGPGPRARDLALALYRFAPLSRPGDGETVAVVTRRQATRSRIFLDAYGADSALRVAAIDQVEPRLTEHTDLMQSAAAAGDENFARHIAEGHLDHYLKDIAYLRDQHEIYRVALAE
ncbi:phosphotransferase [Dactylosporangium sp. NPDC051485]|uniref:aminoglycoside phosphotransferase family protein n=1 Tax=Dactylosporangium sp. NPDC051485 TaxID=3154846 RepID=UPI0034186DDF